MIFKSTHDVGKYMLKCLLGHYWLKWGVGSLGGLLRHHRLKWTNTQNYQQVNVKKTDLQYCPGKYKLKKSCLVMDVQSLSIPIPRSHNPFGQHEKSKLWPDLNWEVTNSWASVQIWLADNQSVWQSDTWIQNSRTGQRSLFLVLTTTMMSGCPWFVCYVKMFATLGTHYNVTMKINCIALWLCHIRLHWNQEKKKPLSVFRNNKS